MIVAKYYNLMEAAMKTIKTPDELYQMIMDCRKSGFSDYRWCKEHNVPTSTFYSWLKKLRKMNYAIPLAHDTPAVSKQEVVKVDIVEDKPDTEINVSVTDTASIKLECFGTKIEVFNHADPRLLSNVLSALKGVSYAG